MSEGPREGSPMADNKVDLYDATYKRFDEAIYREIRTETWGEDIGQNG